MAGPATNIATLGAVYKGLGVKPFSVYLITLIIGSVGFALVLDLFLGWQAPQSIFEPSQHMHHFTWWESILAIATLLIFMRYLIQWLRFNILKIKRDRMSQRRHIILDRQISLGVSGLTCQNCVRRLESSLLQNKEITHCKVSDTLNQLEVHGAITITKLKAAVIEAGFQALDEIK